MPSPKPRCDRLRPPRVKGPPCAPHSAAGKNRGASAMLPDRPHTALSGGKWAGLPPPLRAGGGTGGRGRTPPRGRGRSTAARCCAARVRARRLVSQPKRCGPQAWTELLMSSCHRSWFFRVTLAAASLLRREQRARPLAARPAPRPRSQALGKCAASPQLPGLSAWPGRGPRPQVPP